MLKLLPNVLLINAPDNSANSIWDWARVPEYVYKGSLTYILQENKVNFIHVEGNPTESKNKKYYKVHFQKEQSTPLCTLKKRCGEEYRQKNTSSTIFHTYSGRESSPRHFVVGELEEIWLLLQLKSQAAGQKQLRYYCKVTKLLNQIPGPVFCKQIRWLLASSLDKWHVEGFFHTGARRSMG